MQLPMCSGLAPWLDRLKAVFSDKKDYKLDSLPGHSKISNSNADKFFVISTQADYTRNTLAKKGYWLRFLNCPVYLLFSRFEHCLKTQFSAVFARLLISWG